MIYVSTKQTKYFIVTRFQKMFGLLISGRLVDTNFREVDTTHAVIDVPDADNFNHVVVSPKYTQIVTNLLIWNYGLVHSTFDVLVHFVHTLLRYF